MDLALHLIELPVRLRTVVPMTDDELMQFCAANETMRVEREANGEILVMTPAGAKTGKMNLRIGRILDEWTESDGRGVAFDSSTGFTLPDGSMRNPDGAWMLAARWDALSAEDQGRFAPVCPEFIVELRSPSDGIKELRLKMEIWISNGAELAWLIDPIERAVTIYRAGEVPEHLIEPTSVQGTGPVAGFELVMSRIWQ
jgi:Uma2 family endonuclease